MFPPYRILPLLVLALGLPSCDSVKTKALAFLDEKIEQTAPDPADPTGPADPTAPDESPGQDDMDDTTPPPAVATASAQERIRKINGDGEYAEFTKLAGHVVVVDFYADWCGPCRGLAPILDSIVEDNGGRVLLGKVDVDQNREIAAREGVRGIPDVRIFVNGKEVDRFVGLPPADQVRSKIEPHLAKLSSAAPKPAPKPEPPAPKPADPKQPDTKPEETKPPGEEPKIKPMDKDWLPPGVQRKGA